MRPTLPRLERPRVLLLLLLLSACRNREAAAADVFAKGSFAVTQALTARGEVLGHLLMDLAEGKAKDGAAVRREVAASLAWLQAERERLAGQRLPAMAPLATYRGVILAYLSWEADHFAAIEEVARRLENSPGDVRQRGAMVLAALEPTNTQEMEWKAKGDKALDGLYAHLKKAQ